MPRLAIIAPLLLAAGCGWDGHFTLLGYNTKPNYDTGVKTVYVPIFQNKAFQTTPYRMLEGDLTRAVVREIEQKTPYKVVSDPERADTELLGTLISIQKTIVNQNQQNLIREGEIIITVDLVWRDLRDGRILSNRGRDNPDADPANLPVFDPTNPPPVAVIDQAPRPVRVVAVGRLVPELGESNTTAVQMAVNRMAVQIVSMMEKAW
jgi:hypothetical protein